MSDIQRFEIQKPETILKLADELKRFITERNLSITLQNRQYVQVEGWQFCGINLGLIPVVISITNESNESEYKYRAEVELQSVVTGKRVGYGIALCSNKEPGKKHFAEYAIASMSQTRAIGKAYRNVLAWIIRAAGYEATPAEEMDAIQVSEVVKDTDLNVTQDLPMSEKQENYISELLENRFIPDESVQKIKRSMSSFTVQRASDCIEYLKDLIKTNSQTTFNH